MRHRILPLAMGAGMGLMMLWMVHMQLTGDSTRSMGALVIFVGAHVAVLAVALALPFVASARLRRVLDRVHRPSVHHIMLMLTGALLAAGLAHVLLHSGAF